jgi:Coenzyme PQQ synthesis protein D (PqqD)
MRISRSIRMTVTQGGEVLMDIQRGSMLTLNPAGTIMWQQLSDGCSPSQVADQLASKFAIPHEQASADVNEFLEQLQAQRLIDPSDSVDSGTRLGSKLTGLFQFVWEARF